MFTNFEKIFYQIKNTLLNSNDFKKLVFYNSADALSKSGIPTYEEAAQNVYVKPIIYVYDDSPEFGLSTFVSIGLFESIVLDGSLSSSIKISVACDRQVWELNDYRVRPLAILSEIAKLNEMKFDVAGKLILRVVKEVYFNNDLVGYTALFDIDEEKGDVVNEF
jgi:hypothetical protein